MGQEPGKAGVKGNEAEISVQRGIPSLPDDVWVWWNSVDGTLQVTDGIFPRPITAAKYCLVKEE